MLARVPIKTKSYPTLTETVKNQIVFILNGVERTGRLLFPGQLNGVDTIGFHLHFLTKDHTAGEHLLECTIKTATVEIDQTNNYHLLIS